MHLSKFYLLISKILQLHHRLLLLFLDDDNNPNYCCAHPFMSVEFAYDNIIF